MEEIIIDQERFNEELRKGQEILKKELRKGQEKLQEELKKGQERLQEELRKGQEKLQEELRKSLEIFQENMMRRIEEEMRRTRISVNDNETNNILKQLSVTKIEDINKLNEQNKKCIICLEEFKNDDKSIYLPCFHLFHEKCITDWINMNKRFCPFCRAKINIINNY